MKQLNFRVNGLQELAQFAHTFIQQVPLDRVIAFYGQMGAGKTTLIRAICEALNVAETVTSPTFALVNEYSSENISKIYHFDFYRINKIEEAYDMGYEEYFFSGFPCFVEWPEKIEALLPEDAVLVTIDVLSDNERGIKIQFV